SRDTPELLEGAKIVLQKRCDDSTGWSCSNKFLLWARTLEGDKALELFRYQLAKKTYSNLFDTHAPFQIDGNFGSAAGVMELLMQSQTGVIYILPALPAVWDKGEISGIKAKNGAAVDINWVDNEAESFTITPVSDGDITIGYDRENGTFMLNNEEYVDMRNGKKYTIKNASAGTTYAFTAVEPQDNPPADDKPEITITDGRVSVKNASGGILVIAGYKTGGALIRTNIIDGYSASLEDYDGCHEIKAFLWDSVSGMKPLAESVSYIITN
ncbi:MAG: glycosyl hydrolase family 95 catalytic domain-containing protein, partial [Candidatus Ornithomonoglobus sp.]